MQMVVTNFFVLLGIPQSDARRVQNQRFYQQTVEALDSQAARKLEQDDEGVFKKLRPGVGEERVIAVERQKYDDNKSEGKTGGSDGVIEGDIEVTDNRKSNEVPIAGGRRKPRPGAGDAPPQQKDSEKEEDPEVEAELNSILKRSPSMSTNQLPHFGFVWKAANP
jgi:hypothetical protein